MLKTDYKDDMFAGARKYSLVANEDRTTSLVDMTQYTQEGDQFGANDINDTNKEINKMEAVKSVTLTIAGWSSSAPYTQTVNVEGVSANDRPVISLYMSVGATQDKDKQIKKSFGYLNYIDTGDGTITATCKWKKPAADFQIMIKGV